jgi:hypothetical protein
MKANMAAVRIISFTPRLPADPNPRTSNTRAGGMNAMFVAFSNGDDASIGAVEP